MIKRRFKIIIGVISILLILISLFSNSILFNSVHGGVLFLDSKNLINENWGVQLPKSGDKIYSINSEISFNGDGVRYSVYKYKNKDDLKNVFDFKDKKDKTVEEDIFQILKFLKEDDRNIPEKYKVNLDKKYKYITKTRNDNSRLYLIYIMEENRVYVIENII